MTVAPSNHSTVDASQDHVANPRRRPPRRVDHTYRDYSHFPADEVPGKKTASNFPSKLYQILSTEEFAHIISWMPHGRGWKIHDRALLIKEVVPRYFVLSKYESFSRQLNGWGFKRLHQSGNDFNTYYHECFLRGHPHLTALMKRVPQNQGKLIPHVEGEPNFYEIDRQFPLLPSTPLMPHQAWETGAGYGYGAPSGLPGTPPEPQAEYYCQEYFAHQIRNYPPPSLQYYAGPPGDPYRAHGPPPGYPPHRFYPAQYGQPHGNYQHHPDQSGSPRGAPPYIIGPSLAGGAGLVTSEETSWGAAVRGGGQQDKVSVGGEWGGECLEPWSIFEEAENSAMSGEHDVVHKGKR